MPRYVKKQCNLFERPDAMLQKAGPEMAKIVLSSKGKLVSCRDSAPGSVSEASKESDVRSNVTITQSGISRLTIGCPHAGVWLQPT